MSKSHNFFDNSVETKKAKGSKPFFAVKNAPSREQLKWLNQEVVNRESFYETDFKTMHFNLRCYRNDYNRMGSGRQSDNFMSYEHFFRKKTSDYHVNHLHEMTENLVSRINRLKPNVEIIPSNEEFADRNSAVISKLFYNHITYENRIDDIYQKLHRHKYIFGNAYPCIEFNKEKGDFSEEFNSWRKGEREGEFTGNVRNGDVEISLSLPWTVLPEINDNWDKIKSCITWEVLHQEEVFKRFPKSKGRTAKKFRNFNVQLGDYEEVANHFKVFRFLHKADDDFPMGKEIFFTHDMILEENDLPYSHGTFPFVRITDLDVPGKLMGVSRYSQALILQRAHNNLSKTFMKSEFHFATPKIIAPKGAMNVEQMNNGHTAWLFSGPVAPIVQQFSPTSQASFNFRTMIKNEMEQIMNVYGQSRGEPQKGITSKVALQFLNEQENERSIVDIVKHKSLVVDIAKHILSVAGDYYGADKKRLIRIIGKENEYLTKSFDTAHLSKAYDVRIQNSSAIPESKSARIERIMTALQYGSDMFTPQEWATMLEFGSTEKFHTLVSAAINSAESQVEDILQGNDVVPPEEHEDIITHLRVYYKAVQKRSFKEDVPEDNKQAMRDHIEATEMLASEKAQVNPLFSSKLAQLELFPMFYDIGEHPLSRGQLELANTPPADEPASLETQRNKSNK